MDKYTCGICGKKNDLVVSPNHKRSYYFIACRECGLRSRFSTREGCITNFEAGEKGLSIDEAWSIKPKKEQELIV